MEASTTAADANRSNSGGAQAVAVRFEPELDALSVPHSNAAAHLLRTSSRCQPNGRSPTAAPAYSKPASEATLGLTRPRSGCTSRGLLTGLVTARFVLASSIWLPEGPLLNDLIAIVKKHEIARHVPGSRQVLTPASLAFLQALT